MFIIKVQEDVVKMGSSEWAQIQLTGVLLEEVRAQGKRKDHVRS